MSICFVLRSLYEEPGCPKDIRLPVHLSGSSGREIQELTHKHRMTDTQHLRKKGTGLKPELGKTGLSCSVADLVGWQKEVGGQIKMQFSEEAVFMLLRSQAKEPGGLSLNLAPAM